MIDPLGCNLLDVALHLIEIMKVEVFKDSAPARVAVFELVLQLVNGALLLRDHFREILHFHPVLHFMLGQELVYVLHNCGMDEELDGDVHLSGIRPEIDGILRYRRVQHLQSFYVLFSFRNDFDKFEIFKAKSKRKILFYPLYLNE